MDFSGILVLPFSALVAFVTVIGAVFASRSKPRLIWPFAFSSLIVVPIFLQWPGSPEAFIWLFAVFGLAFSAAVGTLLGGFAARAVICIVRLSRGN